MLEKIKYYFCLKSVDKDIANSQFDIALEKLNSLIRADFRPSVTYLKRGLLCKKLFMYDSAYSDFTFIITHCADKTNAYYERLYINFEISNFYQAISDANTILKWDSENNDIKRIKFLSLVYSSEKQAAYNFIQTMFSNKYKILQYIFNEVAKALAKDEYQKSLKLLEIIDLIDKDNPLKLLKEANINALIGRHENEEFLLKKIDSVFPKYFISKFKYTDIYTEKDLPEICFLLELQIFDKQGIFLYQMQILNGYKSYAEGHITEAKEHFEKAAGINPQKPEAYVLIAQISQFMSNYDNPDLKINAEQNYRKAYSIYKKEGLQEKAERMKLELNHLNSNMSLSLH